MVYEYDLVNFIIAYRWTKNMKHHATPYTHNTITYILQALAKHSRKIIEFCHIHSHIILKYLLQYYYLIKYTSVLT